MFRLTTIKTVPILTSDVKDHLLGVFRPRASRCSAGIGSSVFFSGHRQDFKSAVRIDLLTMTEGQQTGLWERNSRQSIFRVVENGNRVKKSLLEKECIKAE